MSPRQAEETSRHVTCSEIECQVLDKLTNRFWVRPKYYIETPMPRITLGTVSNRTEWATIESFFENVRKFYWKIRLLISIFMIANLEFCAFIFLCIFE